MIFGTHVLLYSTNADADRAFFEDVLELSSVDAGRGWLIFGLPPAEIAVHPSDDGPVRHAEGTMLGAHVYFMCDDIEAAVRMLEGKGVPCTPRQRERWGIEDDAAAAERRGTGPDQPTHPIAIAK